MDLKNTFCANMPESEIPACWKDENRLNVLFAPFRDKRINPFEWDSKYADWKNLIYLYTNHNKLLSFTLLDIEKAFTYHKRSPGCLKIVLEEMEKEGIIQQLQEYTKKRSDSWMGWMTDTFVKNPISWSFTKVKNSFGNSINNYVHLMVIQDISKELLKKIPNEYENKVIDTKQLFKLIKEENFTQQDLEIILQYLNYNKKVVLGFHSTDNLSNNVKLIKFGNTPISNKDVNIYILETCENNLIEEVEKLEARSLKLRDEAKECICKGNKHMVSILKY